MPLDLYLAFVLATTVLILIPGPAVTLIVANSLVWPRSVIVAKRPAAVWATAGLLDAKTVTPLVENRR